MMVRSASLTYSQTNGTLLPGVITTPVYFGMDPGNVMAPGLGFVFGSQEDITAKAGDLGWLTKNPKQPNQFQNLYRKPQFPCGSGALERYPITAKCHEGSRFEQYFNLQVPRSITGYHPWFGRRILPL